MSVHEADQDVLGVPEYLTAELIDGALFLSRRGTPRHSAAVADEDRPRWKPELRAPSRQFGHEHGLTLFRRPRWDVAG